MWRPNEINIIINTERESFFFEIVERRGVYDSYGAANALFRIAAQRRHLRPKVVPKN
ncbi:hypothetical protein K1W69_05775 [Hoeflea sp. WL0058]|uniref:Uncharacterized protein n=1 Tax=Flavimaribacter sediminis TaxID=2865987 RepID=A0AAE2ZHD3_9HYPH|nr:hypothetical protein [Flavimaribacter sediminis]MBW8636694.1 hypothetical protein [Flavimaribacter sediminis]